ncbi:hypothetical protein D910_10796 [Dendroctonus ponderosae]|uniref:Tudor domain-containing protein n=1 Tax=Dendroctonus ponderosae TaxID=77166 RepID=U4UK58_DENPD|nr:hypothetical protein D910_10796 [Dendroctonus ponderosae]
MPLSIMLCSYSQNDRRKLRDRGDGDWGDKGYRERGDRRDQDWNDKSERGDRADRGDRNRGPRDREHSDRSRGDREQNDRVQKDRYSANDRINRFRNDNKSNNWNNTDDVFENTPTWNSNGNEAKSSVDKNDSWADSTPSSNQNSYETYQPKDDKYAGRKRFEDRDSSRQDGKSWNKKDNLRADISKKGFIKDGSDLSLSGSDKGSRKGGRAISKSEYNDTGAAPNTETFTQLDVVGSEAAPEFKTMMEEIQQFYKGRKAELSAVGAPVIGLFPEDSVLYRGQVLEVLGNQYKVLYVDFGNVSTVNKVWPIDKKFMQMPAQAICCGFKGIEPIGGNWPDPSTFAQYFGKDCFMARFLEKNDDRRPGERYSQNMYGSPTGFPWWLNNFLRWNFFGVLLPRTLW